MRINRLNCIFPLIIIFLMMSSAKAVVYEASTLHNGVSRSETVQGMFYNRWDTIIEDSLYLDFYCRINWLQGFQVKAYNRGTGDTQATDMTLVRTYGSVTLNFPILGNNYIDEIKKRVSFESAPEDIPAEEDAEKTGFSKYWDKDNLLVGFTTTGFHYGLTRKAAVDRGDAGEQTVSDYKFSQFFDDIYALSVIYIPYLYVHGGIVVNNQIEPDDNGTIDYGNSSNREIRYFFASNIFSFLNANATVAEREFEVIAVAVNINQLIKPLYEVPKLIPELTAGYKQIALYNDAPYDPVWVEDYYIGQLINLKNSEMRESSRDHAKLRLYTLLLEEDVKNILFASYYIEFQGTDKTIVDKRTNEDIDVKPVKDMYAVLGVNLFGFTDAKNVRFKLSGGWSNFWDPAVAVHRDSGSGYSVNGWIFKAEFNMPLGGFYFMVNKNYSEELRKLVEATDKLALEGCLYLRI